MELDKELVDKKAEEIFDIVLDLSETKAKSKVIAIIEQSFKDGYSQCATQTNTLINQIIDTTPLPPIAQNALTKEEATERIKKDRNNLKWAISGFIRNKYLGK